MHKMLVFDILFAGCKGIQTFIELVHEKLLIEWHGYRFTHDKDCSLHRDVKPVYWIIMWYFNTSRVYFNFFVSTLLVCYTTVAFNLTGTIEQ